jgi:hypothetical protein
VTTRQLWTTTAITALAGVLLTAAGLFVDYQVGIEGAYFSRSVGAPAHVASFSGETWPHDGMLGAGLALMLVAAGAAVIGARTIGAAVQAQSVRRVTVACALAALVVGATGVIRAATGPNGISFWTNIREGGILSSRLFLAPDLLLGAALGFAAGAAALAVNRRRSAPSA